MLSRFEQIESESIRMASSEVPQPEELKALGANLPARLDRHLKKLVDTAMERYGKRDTDIKRKLAVLSSGRYTDADFQAVLKALNTTRKGPVPRTHLCAWALGLADLTPDDRRTAAVSLRRLLRSAPSFLLMPGERRMLRAALWTLPFSVPLGLLATFPFWSKLNVIGMSAALLASFLLSACLFLPSLLFAHETERKAARQLRFLAAHALGRLQSLEAADALASASLEQDPYLSEMALISLRVVLPHLSSDDYGRYGPVTPNLCRLLQRHAPTSASYHDADHTLTTELLDALEKVGDARAIPHFLQRAIEWPPGPLREKAERVLAILEERKRRETERETLLRGTAQPAIQDDELLRASMNQVESRPEQLLRPVIDGQVNEP